MKSRTYFGITLLIPYLLWGICGIIAALLSKQEISETWNMILLPVFYYLIGIIFWFIPYTILAIGMWIWSKGRSIKSVKTLILIAPFVLFILTWIEMAAITLPGQSAAESGNYILGISALTGGFSIVFGYFCIGIALGIYKLLKKRNMIMDETPTAA